MAPLAFLIFCCALLDKPPVAAAPGAPPARIAEAPRQISASLDMSITGNRIFWTVNTKNDRLAYEIDLDTRTMRFRGEARRFSAEEAAVVKLGLGQERNTMWWAALFHYLSDSMAWWEAGEGEKLLQSDLKKEET